MTGIVCEKGDRSLAWQWTPRRFSARHVDTEGLILGVGERGEGVVAVSGHQLSPRSSLAPLRPAIGPSGSLRQRSLYAAVSPGPDVRAPPPPLCAGGGSARTALRGAEDSRLSRGLREGGRLSCHVPRSRRPSFHGGFLFARGCFRGFSGPQTDRKEPVPQLRPGECLGRPEGPRRSLLRRFGAS